MWVGLGQVGPMSWTIFFLISIIIIKLRIRTTLPQIRANLLLKHHERNTKQIQEEFRV